MIVRRGPAIVLSLVLSAAALSVAPALAKDGGAAKDVDRDQCDPSSVSRAKLKVEQVDGNNSRLQVTGTVWSDDSDVWAWRLKHEGEVSDDGRARGSENSDLSFRVVRTMFNLPGTDDVVFRAENLRTGEVCRATVSY
ncbi:hypothetical protein [Nocardioides aquiterrae]|uniref:Secreted protein n=1 Tax=Nocardioides aquiterrae TaxID=203799 RepID=A0ABN1UFS3_9ACTN